MTGPTYSQFLNKLGHEFVTNVEVVPPAAPHSADLTAAIANIAQTLPVDGVNVADSPMATPKMSAMLFALPLRAQLPAGVEIIPHITARDHNRVALQGLMWGAAACGIRTVLIVSGDSVRYSNDPATRLVADLDIPAITRLAREAGLTPGVVFDPRPAQRQHELRKLEQKLAAGAAFVITQPVYAPAEAEDLWRDLAGRGAPVLLGLLPLVSLRHAVFLNERVPGISLPAHLLDQMRAAGPDALSVGLDNARRMLGAARERFAGVCIMPPFHRFALLRELLPHAAAM